MYHDDDNVSCYRVFLYKYEVNGLLNINVIQKNDHALQHDKKYKPVVSITNNYSCYNYLKLKLLKPFSVIEIELKYIFFTILDDN